MMRKLPQRPRSPPRSRCKRADSWAAMLITGVDSVSYIVRYTRQSLRTNTNMLPLAPLHTRSCSSSYSVDHSAAGLRPTGNRTCTDYVMAISTTTLRTVCCIQSGSGMPSSPRGVRDMASNDTVACAAPCHCQSPWTDTSKVPSGPRPSTPALLLRTRRDASEATSLSIGRTATSYRRRPGAA